MNCKLSVTIIMKTIAIIIIILTLLMFWVYKIANWRYED